MIDVSFWEIVVIAVACLIFLKPEDVPDIMRRAGRFFRKIKKMVSEFTSVLDETEADIVKPKNKILGLDGKYHDAYDVNEVFKDDLGKKLEIFEKNEQHHQ